MKIAVVHDYLNQLGGAERVFAAITKIFPRAPVYTLLYNRELFAARLEGREVHTSWLQRMPFSRRFYEKYLPFFPIFIEQFDLSGFDLVVSDSSAWAKGVLTFPPTCHVSYIHTPMRFGWDYASQTVAGMPKALRGVLRLTLNYLRIWDVVATKRVDYLACNSASVRTRILKYYGRDADVIPPPVDTTFYRPVDNGDRRPPHVPQGNYYLTVCRLKPYKRIDLAVEAFRGLDARLVVVGNGPEAAALRAIAGPNVTFVPTATNEQLRDYYRYCSAFVMPAHEDFGIACVEAMACGRPVIAYGRGGARDTVIDGVTGRFFRAQTAASLREAVVSFRPNGYDPRSIRNHAARFDTSRFETRFAEYVWDCYKRSRDNRGVVDSPSITAESSQPLEYSTISHPV